MSKDEMINNLVKRWASEISLPELKAYFIEKQQELLKSLNDDELKDAYNYEFNGYNTL